MSQPHDVVVIVGSLRKDSYNRIMANELAKLAPESLRLEIVEIRDLPLYDQDLEAAPPAPWLVFRERLKRARAVLFVTPEYNRSVPACLKNALDVGSRPPGQSAWSGAPCAVVSVTPGALGGFGANHHLRQSFVFMNMPCMQQPEAYIGGAANVFRPEGGFVNDTTRDLMQRFMKTFAAWIESNPRP